MKTKVKNAFRTAELGYIVNRSNQTLTQYPSVLSIRKDDNKRSVVFKLPNGLNPDLLFEKEYVFKQYFGENIEFEMKNNLGILKIYNQSLPDLYEFKYEDFVGHMKKYKLPIIAGKNRGGEVVVYDMVNHPHLLVAGETGSGKSSILRVILTSLIIYKRHSIQLYLGDLKRTEFHLFRNIDNVKAVMTKKEEVNRVLNHIQDMMYERSDLLDMHGFAHIDEYNKHAADKKPYIIVCIDEVARLQKEKDIMDQLEDIGNMGRALGVFLILSMQRPDAKILDGQIKNALTVRYAFQQTDKINSNIVLGSGQHVDASKLEKPGEFYYKNEGIVKLKAPFLDLETARKMIDVYRKPMQKKEEVKEVEQDFIPLPFGDFNER